MSKIEKIRAEIERRLKRENEFLWNAKLRGMAYPPSVDYNLITLTSLRDFIDTLEEESDKSLVEEVKRYYSDNFAYISSDQPTLSILTNVARHFAEWQKEQFEKNRLAHCDALSKEDYGRETDFAMEIIEKEHRQPTFIDAINYGMRLQKEQMMDEWLKDRDGCFWDGVEEGKQAMKEQMLKDAVEADVYAYKAPRFNCGFAEFVVAIPSAETDKLGDKVKLIIVKEDEK